MASSFSISLPQASWRGTDPDRLDGVVDVGGIRLAAEIDHGRGRADQLEQGRHLAAGQAALVAERHVEARALLLKRQLRRSR
jgi:hypothetical protein